MRPTFPSSNFVRPSGRREKREKKKKKIEKGEGEVARYSPKKRE